MARSTPPPDRPPRAAADRQPAEVGRPDAARGDAHRVRAARPRQERAGQERAGQERARPASARHEPRPGERPSARRHVASETPLLPLGAVANADRRPTPDEGLHATPHAHQLAADGAPDDRPPARGRLLDDRRVEPARSVSARPRHPDDLPDHGAGRPGRSEHSAQVRAELQRLTRALRAARTDAEHAARDAASARAEAAQARDEAAQAREEAAGAARAKSEFLATMSHELRTPLNAISGYAQLLELGVGGPLTSQQREYLARLHASSRHLLGLVQDVLDLARIDAGRLSVAADCLPAVAVLRSVMALGTVHAAAAPTVEVDLPDPTARFVGDEHRVRQVLLALLSNACKFAPTTGTVRLWAERRPVADHPVASPGPWIAFHVADSGPGIDPTQHERIFEPFVQQDGSRTRTAGGSGLGLAIARRLARLMHGDVSVASVPGRGATFTLWLPDAAAASTPAPVAADRVDPVDSPPQSGADRASPPPAT